MNLCTFIGHKTTEDNTAACVRCKKIYVSYDEEDIEYED